MEWVLLVSLQWVVAGSATPPIGQQIVLFPSEERCLKAADVVRAEIAKPIDGVQTYGRVMCLNRKEK